MPRNWVIGFALMLLAANGAHAEPYDLRGFKLGMSVEQFRATPFPGKQVTKPFCTGDNLSDVRGVSGLDLASSDSKLGIKRCAFYEVDESMKTVFPNESRFKMAHWDVGGASAEVSFYFASMGGGDATLYNIIVVANGSYWPRLWSAYNEKFGKPSKLINKEVQNKAGAKFNGTNAIWSNPESSIEMTQHFGRIDRMGIVYSLTGLAESINRMRRDMEAKSSASRL